MQYIFKIVNKELRRPLWMTCIVNMEFRDHLTKNKSFRRKHILQYYLFISSTKMNNNSHQKQVLIIGAGPSGLSAAKYALQAGLKPIVLERRPQLGGVWNPQFGYTWDNMTTNLSKFSCQFSDFPWEQGTDILPRSQDFFKYLQRYAQHFKVIEHIHYGCNVTAVEKIDIDGETKYRVTWNEKQQVKKDIFPFLILAAGMFSYPYIPKHKGVEKFKGKIIHSNEYKNAKEWKQKNVLVVGGSFTGIQLASDTAKEVGKTYHIFRSPFWLLGHYVQIDQGQGIPFDLCFHRRNYHKRPKQSYQQSVIGGNKHLLTKCSKQQQIQSLKIDEEQFNRPISVAISTNYLGQVKDGKIIPKRSFIKQFTENGVIVQSSKKDGQVVQIPADVVVFSTGYTMIADYLSEEFKKDIEFDDTQQRKPFVLFNEVAHPEYPNLFFVGMFKTTLIPGCELQARWAIKVFSGQVSLPSKQEMYEQMKEERAYRSLNPQPQAPHIPLIVYADEMARLMGHKLDLQGLKEKNEQLYLKFINLPAIQTHHYFTTDDVQKQIEYLTKVVKESTVKL